MHLYYKVECLSVCHYSSSFKAKLIGETFEPFFFQKKYFMSFIPSALLSFLTKIQNRISEKTRKKTLLLSFKKFVKAQFLGAVEFPSIF
jgi:hypothetical protein